MARNREKHESLVRQVEMKLKLKLAIGQSKHDDKLADKAKRNEKKKPGLGQNQLMRRVTLCKKSIHGIPSGII